MEAKTVNTFIQVIKDIMPQVGFQEVQRGSLTAGETELTGLGVTIIIGLTEELHGNVAYNMTLNTACQIASTMMGGTPVSELDDIAKSAVSELSNMLTANAVTNLANLGIKVNISSPTIIIGNDFKVKISSQRYLCLEMLIDSITLFVNIAIE